MNNSKHKLQRIKQRTLYEINDLMSLVLFRTYKHQYDLGDMIVLFCFMIVLCAFIYIALVVSL